MTARRASSSGCGPAAKRSKGRPLGFDRDEALDAVVSLFWRHGYDGVSLAMLEHASGISKPSLYNSFGNKEELFRLALDRYELEAPGLKLAQLDAAASIGEAIHLLLRGAASTFGRRDGAWAA